MEQRRADLTRAEPEPIVDAPEYNAAPSSATMTMLVGIGVPSKYFTFPVVAVGERRRRDVEPREPADAADDEVREDRPCPSRRAARA